MRARELTEVEWEDSYLEHAFRSETLLLSTSKRLVKSAIQGAMEDIHKIREERLTKIDTEMLKDTEEAFKDRQKWRELAKVKAEEMKKAQKTEIRKKRVKKDNNNYNTNREGLVFTEQFQRELKWKFIPKSE